MTISGTRQIDSKGKKYGFHMNYKHAGYSMKKYFKKNNCCRVGRIALPYILK